ncbi:MAG: divalent metal cation transporter [Thermoleophilia bacterium]|nr:divalent metal cation transporter [Thermoleophilia bacterium]
MVATSRCLRPSAWARATSRARRSNCRRACARATCDRSRSRVCAPSCSTRRPCCHASSSCWRPDESHRPGGRCSSDTPTVSRIEKPIQHRRRGVARRFVALRRSGVAGIAAFLAVLGPGVLAGLSDDDPAGVTTYSILGTDYGYDLLWVIPASTALLIMFHLLAIRLAVETGSGFVALIRNRFGPRAAAVAGASFVVANFGTICAEFAGIGAVAELAGVPKAPCVLGAAALIIVLVIGASFHRVEHVLLAVSAVLASYVVAGILAKPDWPRVAHGLLVPTAPPSSAAYVAVAATLGTTLAPWGLAFIQSYAVDKRIARKDYGLERVEVIVGSILTGVIGVFIAVACAATLGVQGLHIKDASDAARALRPLAGNYASLLFGVGLAGAGLLAAVIVPLATSYSLAEAFGRPSDLDDRTMSDRFFYGSFIVLVISAAVVVSLPGVPLIPVVFVSQIINAVLLAPHLILLVRLNRDTRVVQPERVLSRGWTVLAWGGIVVVLASVASLAVVAVR